MKIIPELSENSKEYMDLLINPVKTSLILTSIKFKVFDHLKNFETPEKLSPKCSSNDLLRQLSSF